MKKPSSSKPTKRRKNATRACNYCKAHHVRCHIGPNDKKCTLCTERGIECVFEFQKKRGPKPKLGPLHVKTHGSRKKRKMARGSSSSRTNALGSVSSPLLVVDGPSRGGDGEDDVFTVWLDPKEFPGYLNAFKERVFPFQPSLEPEFLSLLTDSAVASIDVLADRHFALLAYAAMARGARANGCLRVAKEMALRVMSLAPGASADILAYRGKDQHECAAAELKKRREMFISSQGLLTLAFYLFCDANCELALHYNTMAHELCVASGHSESLVRYFCLTNIVVGTNESEGVRRMHIERLARHFLSNHPGCSAKPVNTDSSTPHAPSSSVDHDGGGGAASVIHGPSTSLSTARATGHAAYRDKSFQKFIADLCLKVSLVTGYCDERFNALLQTPLMARPALSQSDVERFMDCLTVLDDVEIALRVPEDREAFQQQLRGERTADKSIAARYCMPDHISQPFLCIIYALRAGLYHLLSPDTVHRLTLAKHAISHIHESSWNLPTLAFLPLLMILPVLIHAQRLEGVPMLISLLKKRILELSSRYPLFEPRVRSCWIFSQAELRALSPANDVGTKAHLDEPPRTSARRGYRPGHSSAELQQHIKLSDIARAQSQHARGRDSMDDIHLRPNRMSPSSPAMRRLTTPVALPHFGDSSRGRCAAATATPGLPELDTGKAAKDGGDAEAGRRDSSKPSSKQHPGGSLKSLLDAIPT